MARYETTMNKAIIQNWNTLLEMDDSILMSRCLTERQIAALVSMCEYLEWRTRYDNPPAADVLKAFAANLVNALIIGVCEMDCSELTACLTPLFDEMLAKMDEIIASDNQNKAKLPQPFTTPGCDEDAVYGGAIQATIFINELIMDCYEAGEASSANDAAEWMDVVISAIPAFETLPFDDLFFVVDWFYQNQQEDYEGAYTTTWRNQAAHYLKCTLMDNNCELTSVILTAWLSSLPDLFPDNFAAAIFAKFGEGAGEGLLAQLGQAYSEINQRGRQTIEQFYNQVIQQYAIGTKSPVEDITGLSCPSPSDVVPVINDNDWLDGERYGGSITNLGGGVWKVATTNTHSPDWRLTIREENDNPFIISAITYNGVSPQCNWYNYEEANAHVFDGCTGLPAYTGAALLSFGKTFIGYTEMTFTMTAPEE